MTGSVQTMAAESPETLAASSSEPVALGPGPVSVTLALSSSSKAQPLSERVTTVQPGHKAYLLVKGLGTNEPPEVVYQIYPALPAGAAPNPDGLHYVGSFNFFNAMKYGKSAG